MDQKRVYEYDYKKVLLRKKSIDPNKNPVSLETHQELKHEASKSQQVQIQKDLQKEHRGSFSESFEP